MYYWVSWGERPPAVPWGDVWRTEPSPFMLQMLKMKSCESIGCMSGSSLLDLRGKQRRCCLVYYSINAMLYSQTNYANYREYTSFQVFWPRDTRLNYDAWMTSCGETQCEWKAFLFCVDDIWKCQWSILQQSNQSCQKVSKFNPALHSHLIQSV